MVQDQDKTAVQVIKRLLAAMAFTLSGGPIQKGIRPPTVPLRTRAIAHLAGLGHQPKLRTLGIRCNRCKVKWTLKRSLLTGPCPGQSQATSHQLAHIKGLTFCSVCGFTESRPRHSKALRAECSGRGAAPKSRLQTLKRLLNGKPPYQLKSWPDGTPIPKRARRR